MNANVENNEIVSYAVNAKISFTLDWISQMAFIIFRFRHR